MFMHQTDRIFDENLLNLLVDLEINREKNHPWVSFLIF